MFVWRFSNLCTREKQTVEKGKKKRRIEHSKQSGSQSKGQAVSMKGMLMCITGPVDFAVRPTHAAKGLDDTRRASFHRTPPQSTIDSSELRTRQSDQ